MSMIRKPGRTVASRRTVLGGALAVAGASAFPMPALAQERSLKVGSYGGYFEDSFKKHVFPAFTEATGIAVESVTQPNSADWLVTMQQAAKSGTVPTDLSLYGRDTMIKAQRIGGLIQPLAVGDVEAVQSMDPYFVFKDGDDALGVAAMAWFTSMVVNPNTVETPASWADFWDTSKFESSLGLSKVFSANFLDIVAATFFDGKDTLMTKDGIMATIAKTAEIKPNVALWWSAESQMEQALKNQDVVGGMYYHDVAGIMASDGFPVLSVFPKEGNPRAYGSWCLSEGSSKGDEAKEFVAFTSQPSSQALMSRKIGVAPIIDPGKTELSAEELAAVSGTPAIDIAYEAYLDNETFIKDAWDKMLASS